MNFIFIFLFIFFIPGQHLQDSIRILFQGVVMDSETLKPMPGSQLSVNRKALTVTGPEGKFAFYVNINDTVSISMIGYKRTDLIISDSLAGKPYTTGVFMTNDTVSIGEVIIVPRMSVMKSEILNPRPVMNPEIENAKYNVAVSAYQGKRTTGSLGDPVSNYELLRQRHKTEAYEKGGIPSEKMVGLSPFMLLPAAYLLIHGLPEKPQPFQPEVSDYELDLIVREYLKRQNP